MRERVEFPNLACLQLGKRTAYFFQPEERIIHGGWLGSSAAYRVHLPLRSLGKVRVIGAVVSPAKL